MRSGLVGLGSAMVVVWTMVTAGCSSSGATVGTGGRSSSGGTVGTGGSSTGGTVGTGGSSGGGTVGTGGSSGGGTGGTGGSSSGGTVGTGGSSSGGTVGTGGSSSGGTVGTGGSSSSGGTGAGGASEDSVTTLSGTTVLDALTTEEATQLCDDTNAYFGRTVSRATLCKWNGLSYAVSSSAPSDTQLQENCTTQETACLQGNPDSPSCGELPSVCEATVAEHSACAIDQAAAYNDVVSGLPSCATVTRPDLAAVWNFLAGDPPASCTSLNDKCPGISYPIPR